MSKTADVKATIGADYQFTTLGGRDRFPIAVKRVLVPTDLARESERAVEFGLVLAQHFGAHLTLLHVFDESYAVEYLCGPHASEELRKNESIR